MSEISVRLYDPSLKKEWQDFLAASNNGTLFHDQEFLSYHPVGRFERHSLMLYQDNRLRALFPAARHREADGTRTLLSPFGASVGGLVLADGTNTGLAIELIEKLQDYASGADFDAVEMRIAPSIYQEKPDDLLPFALALRNFKLTKYSLTYGVKLDFDSHEGMLSNLSKSKRYDVRKSVDKGLITREAGTEGFERFHELLISTYARHSSEPTHQRAELERILELCPGRARIFLAEHEGSAVAGVLVFVLNRSAAYTFYICEEREKQDLCGPAALVGYVQEKLREEGVRYLDLGPSVSDSHFNPGVVFFKEGMGARGFLRSTWRWARLAGSGG